MVNTPSNISVSISVETFNLPFQSTEISRDDMASIRTHSTYDRHGYTYYPVAIIGAGESGIAMGCQLKQQLKFDQFRIFERRSGIGGTWWSNRYPGVACDMYVSLQMECVMQQTERGRYSTVQQCYIPSPLHKTQNGLRLSHQEKKLQSIWPTFVLNSKSWTNYNSTLR